MCNSSLRNIGSSNLMVVGPNFLHGYLWSLSSNLRLLPQTQHPHRLHPQSPALPRRTQEHFEGSRGEGHPLSQPLGKATSSGFAFAVSHLEGCAGCCTPPPPLQLRARHSSAVCWERASVGDRAPLRGREPPMGQIPMAMGLRPILRAHIHGADTWPWG